MLLKSDSVEVCNRAYAEGFVTAYAGNLSVRTDNNTISITPSGKCKGEISEKDLMEMDYKWRLIKGAGKISTESRLHFFAYQMRADIGCVKHCYLAHAAVLTTKGEVLSVLLFTEILYSPETFPLCKYAALSTDELAISMILFIKHAWVLLLENHGAVTSGNII
jgi:ribulose-5-phosphate 4-epimerase/fuculose-1-phosphate aldolase